MKIAITVTHDDDTVYITECEVDIEQIKDDTIVSKLIGPMQAALQAQCDELNFDQLRWRDK